VNYCADRPHRNPNRARCRIHVLIITMIAFFPLMEFGLARASAVTGGVAGAAGAGVAERSPAPASAADGS